MRLSREQILDAADCTIENMDVPEWGGTIGIATLGAHDRMSWERAAFPDGGAVDMDQYMAGLVLRCVVDDDGKPAFTEADLATLANKNPAVLKRVFEAASALNGIGVQAAQAAEKNSEATPADAGSSP